MSERPKILVTQKIPADAYSLLHAIGEVEANMDEGVIWSPEELSRRAPGHDYLLCLLTDTIDARLLGACASASPRLKLVANMAVGYNNIDVEAATRQQIAVSNTPGILSDTTADLAFALLLATARRLPEAERFLRAGKFTGWGPLLFCGAEVHGSTLGIIGAGRIGQLMAKRASGFDMRVLYYNTKCLPADIEDAYQLTYGGLDELLSQSDFVSLHVPYASSTHHLIGERELALMKPSAILVNTARGPVVDEKALVRALQSGQIAGAGLDVFEHEPAVEPELLSMENVVLVPHIASASLKTRARMATMAAENIVAHVQGQRPPNQVNR
ncbi:2-hydroxyacid dehydrogenase [Ktedonobacter racemifer]|uniref:D-isomer specific 2-hydroxyacid dehydrogenase NAD-binding n=1 Tax=Ktedonobacter racemifer DSM 44963 TaxID=485913 RepID=D6TLW0_KTERA|nr:D-glycerate dehydrogenase [Ktedonobacter racemifer]EFH86760.1 D-isomer specific 2-hydroxyacid dehydrogenase NAD-binding [Ktedonobacter racemifer DSM 44963]